MSKSFILEQVIVGPLEVNCYILGSPKTGEAIIIDPGDDFVKIKEVLDKNNLRAKLIINTHGHFDHIGADDKFDLPVYIHHLDKDCLTNPEKNFSSFFNQGKTFDLKINSLSDNDKVGIDTLELDVIHTPGHTPGGICLKIEDSIFTGDTLFCQGIGRTDFPNASGEQLMQSIKEKLLKFSDEIKIYPGHGPSSTIGNERQRNPFLSVL